MTKRWLALSLRERVILLVMLPLLTVALVDIFYTQPQERLAKRVLSQAANLEADNGRLQEQIEQLRAKLKGKSVSELSAKQQQLSEALQRQRRQIRAVTAALIPPEVMADVLQTMLEKRGKLNLVSLENLQAEAVEGTKHEQNGQDDMAADSQEKTASNGAEEPLLYRHPIRLRIRGRYFDVVQYLKALENLKHKFFWDELRYKVDKYPVANVELVVSTLGTDAYLMGAGKEPSEAAHD